MKISTSGGVVEKIPVKLPFIKLCLNGKTISKFKGISGTGLFLLLEMVRTMDDENVIVWTPIKRNKFCQNNRICLKRSGEVSTASFSNFMASMCTKNLIRKLRRGQYQVNPSIFAKGKWDSIYFIKKNFKKR